MGPGDVLEAIGIAWGLATVAILGYPLVTGRMRAGLPGSDPVERERDPGTFWTAYGVSAFILVAATGVVAWVLSTLSGTGK